VDYTVLNKATVKNQYPLPRMDHLFDRLLGAKVFSRIDLCLGYYQIWIAEGDEEKITCRIRYGSYKFLVMPFRFTNAPATFCTFMNDIFWEWLDDFVMHSQLLARLKSESKYKTMEGGGIGTCSLA